MRLILFSIFIFSIGCGDSEFPTQVNSTQTPNVDGKSDHSSADASGFDASQDVGISIPNEEAIFKLIAPNANRVEVWVFDEATKKEPLQRIVMQKQGDTWNAKIRWDSIGTANHLFYGFRLWGPNWTYAPTWVPGTEIGFLKDVDEKGNRFNPNKLVFDPAGIELSHDPITPNQLDGTVFASGPNFRAIDSAAAAPKSILLKQSISPALQSTAIHPLRDDIIYEVHVRGFTKNDPSIPEDLRGTYAGAAKKAVYLAELGITAVEFLPLHEMQNETNDVEMSTQGDNYWGYASLSYFAPDRRYAFDKTPGGPTKELIEMVNAFHDVGIKVFVDVVFNHTGEGGLWDSTGDVASLLSWRGIDNSAYYELADNSKFYYDNNGVGPNFNVAGEVGRNHLMDSLRYWHEELGVDGFRFDLASVLGNRCERGCFEFDKLDPKNVLNRFVNEIALRPEDGGKGVDLIAEPWAIGGGTFQLGNFPAGWAEWNGRYRDVIRADQNAVGVESVTPANLISQIAGSSDLFQDDGRRPWHSINFITAHDGFTLNDLYACNAPNNNQDWPYGPSDGGHDHNLSWDHNNDRSAQRQAARTGLALMMLSAGTPMIRGGDEFLRTTQCNNNPYNVDSIASWLDYKYVESEASFLEFSKKLFQFRKAHNAFKPAFFWTGEDTNQNGVPQIQWLNSDGIPMLNNQLTDPNEHFVAYMLDGAELGDSQKLFVVAYNGGDTDRRFSLPTNARGATRILDTAAWLEAQNNFDDEGTIIASEYVLKPRSLVVFQMP